MGCPQDYDGTVLSLAAIADAVESRLHVSLIHRKSVKEPVEHLGSRLRCAASYHEDASYKTPVMVKLGILDSSNVVKDSIFRYFPGVTFLCRHPVHLTVYVCLQRHLAPQGRLEVMMVRR